MKFVQKVRVLAVVVKSVFEFFDVRAKEFRNEGAAEIAVEAVGVGGCGLRVRGLGLRVAVPNPESLRGREGCGFCVVVHGDQFLCE
jgi:hypothetical protein